MSNVIHQQIYKPGVFGGITNTTICGRIDNSLDDSNKGTEKVTCKHCLNIIKKGQHIKLKWIGWEPPTE